MPGLQTEHRIGEEWSAKQKGVSRVSLLQSAIGVYAEPKLFLSMLHKEDRTRPQYKVLSTPFMLWKNIIAGITITALNKQAD